MQVKVLLVYPNIWSEIFPLSVMTLSAVLKQHGFAVRVFSAEHRRRVNHPPATVYREGPDEGLFDEFRQAVEEFQPHVIGFSIVEDAFPLAERLLDLIPHSAARVIIGGVFATFAPARCISHPRVDAVCIGEGEGPLSELCQKLRDNQPIEKIAGLWIRQDGDKIEKNALAAAVDINTLPTPDYSVLDRSRFQGAVPITAHRGCPYSCTFCNSPAQEKLMQASSSCHFFRKLGITRLRRDLAILTSRFPSTINHQGLYFCSDTFLAWSRQEFDEFIEMYSDYQIPFVCHSTPETITEHKMNRLVSVGLKLMNIGIQHGNETFRRNVLKRTMPNRELINRFAIASACGARTSADFIMGFPLETPALAQDSIDFSRKIRATVKICSLFVPYHGTALRELAVDRGYLHTDTLAVWSPQTSQLNMPEFPAHEIESKLVEFRTPSRAQL